MTGRPFKPHGRIEPMAAAPRSVDWFGTFELACALAASAMLGMLAGFLLVAL